MMGGYMRKHDIAVEPTQWQRVSTVEFPRKN